MSFSSNIKTEISKENVSKAEALAELSAIFRNNVTISEDLIEVHTENSAIARRIYSLLKKNLNINIEIEIKEKTNELKNHTYSVIIKEAINETLKDLDVLDSNNKLKESPEEYLLDSEEEKAAYLRGIFLSSGSVNDPKTSRYHLELLINSKPHAEFIKKLLNGFNLNSKSIKRNNKYMVYIKEAEKISDFLKIIKASSGVLYFEDIRIYRDLKNMTNRLNNCDQANIEKTINTAKEQINDIKIIKEKLGIETIDEKLKETAEYRIKYPESSLEELSKIISLETDKQVTKSGLNHRLRKLKEIANRLRNNVTNWYYFVIIYIE